MPYVCNRVVNQQHFLLSFLETNTLLFAYLNGNALLFLNRRRVFFLNKTHQLPMNILNFK